MQTRDPSLTAAGRAGALAGLYAWLGAFLQLSLANQLGLSPLFTLWFGLGIGLAHALAGGLAGLLLGLLVGRGLQRPLEATVLSVLAPIGILVFFLSRTTLSGRLAERGDLLLAPTVQAAALVFIGGAACTILVLVTGRALRAGVLTVLGTLIAASTLASGPDQEYADPSTLSSLLAPVTPRPALVLALDGLDWQILDPLLAEDLRRPPGERRLRNLSALVQEGARAPLRASPPLDAPVVWTGLATGRHWSAHGIRDWWLWSARGARRPLAVRGLLAEPAVRLLARGLPGWIEGPRLVGPADRERRSWWEVLGQAGLRCTVVGWPVTHPAPAFDEVAVLSERAFLDSATAEGVSWDPFLPPGDPDRLDLLLAELGSTSHRAELALALRRELADIPWPDPALEQEIVRILQRFLLRVEVLERRILRSGLEAEAGPEVFVLADPLILEASRLLWRYHFPEDPELGDGRPSPREAEALGGVLTRIHEIVDAFALQRLLNALRARGEPLVFIVGPRGLRGREPDPDLGWRAPSAEVDAEGIFLARGPGLATRPDLGELSIHDLAPLLAHAEGVPVAGDLRGRVPEALFAPAWREEHPVRRVPTWEVAGWRERLSRLEEDPEAMEALLTELGCAGEAHEAAEAPEEP